MTAVTYLRDVTLKHVCSRHVTSSQCLQAPWMCVSHCGADITRNEKHRHEAYGAAECVVCIYMRYEVKGA